MGYGGTEGGISLTVGLSTHIQPRDSERYTTEGSLDVMRMTKHGRERTSHVRALPFQSTVMLNPHCTFLRVHSSPANQSSKADYTR